MNHTDNSNQSVRGINQENTRPKAENCAKE